MSKDEPIEHGLARLLATGEPNNRNLVRQLAKKTKINLEVLADHFASICIVDVEPFDETWRKKFDAFPCLDQIKSGRGLSQPHLPFKWLRPFQKPIYYGLPMRCHGAENVDFRAFLYTENYELINAEGYTTESEFYKFDLKDEDFSFDTLLSKYNVAKALVQSELRRYAKDRLMNPIGTHSGGRLAQNKLRFLNIPIKKR